MAPALAQHALMSWSRHAQMAIFILQQLALPVAASAAAEDTAVVRTASEAVPARPKRLERPEIVGPIRLLKLVTDVVSRLAEASSEVTPNPLLVWPSLGHWTANLFVFSLIAFRLFA